MPTRRVELGAVVRHIIESLSADPAIRDLTPEQTWTFLEFLELGVLAVCGPGRAEPCFLRGHVFAAISNKGAGSRDVDENGARMHLELVRHDPAVLTRYGRMLAASLAGTRASRCLFEKSVELLSEYGEASLANGLLEVAREAAGIPEQTASEIAARVKRSGTR